jgi:major vault protein
MELSTGTPKTDAKVERTVYLRVLYNKVSDVIEAETADLVTIRIRLSYRVNFEGDPNRWFSVENYVKFLTEHLRSLVRAAVKAHRVQELHPRVAPLVRDVVLGQPGEGGKRPGRAFEENGMRVYDVEVLDVAIGDAKIDALLVEAQHAVVGQTLTLDAEKRRLELVREREAINREVAQVEAATTRKKIEGDHAVESARLAAKQAEQQAIDAIALAERERQRAAKAVEIEGKQAELALDLQEIAAQVNAVTEKAKAVSPDLVAALQAFGDRALAERMAESMAPLAILGGESVRDVLARLLAGTKVASVLKSTNGAADHAHGEAE